MKKIKYSLSEIAYHEVRKQFPDAPLWVSHQKEWSKIANAVAREVRKRDNMKFEKT
jgi:hypothetical protein